MLRKIRILVSAIIFGIITLYFLDFAGFMPQAFHVLTKIQFLPALLALNILVVAALMAITLLFGRVYCSSICPMGIYQDLVSRLAKRFKKKKRYKYRKAQTILRWAIVGVMIVAFLFGFNLLVGLLDPYSAFGRMTVHLFKPAYLAGNNLLEAIFTRFDNHTFYKVGIYIGSVVSLIIALLTLLGIGLMAWMNGRLYCNTICPVGTLLGACSRYSLFKVRIDESTCNSCGACGRACKATCIDTKAHAIDYSRCINCFNCVDVCSQKAMKFSYSNCKKAPVAAKQTDESKRRFIVALGVGTVAAGKLLANNNIPQLSKNKAIRKTAIAPPGARNVEHLRSHCTSCHLCVSKCPSKVIKPSFTEYGLGGIMQPMLSFEKGFCNYDCTLCSDICPNNALRPLTKEQKHVTQMGQVQFVIENCIVHTDGTSCGACSEHCPTQAVSMIPYKEGLTIPHTDTSICVGCGGCEYVCPAKPYKAIYVEGLATHNTITIKKEKVEKVKVDDFGF